MIKPIREGYSIRFHLPEEIGHEGYSVRCIYKYKKREEKYALQMWLMRDDIGDEFKIDAQEIDTQYISGTRESIEQNIVRIVEHASLCGFFEDYIQKYEYTYDCFDYGNSHYENEILKSSKEEN